MYSIIICFNFNIVVIKIEGWSDDQNYLKKIFTKKYRQIQYI